MPSSDEIAHGIGQVELALGVDGLQAPERRPEQVAPEARSRSSPRRSRAARRRIARLDDRLKITAGVTDDPPVAPDVVRDEREHGCAGVLRAMRRQQRLEQSGRQQWSVAERTLPPSPLRPPPPRRSAPHPRPERLLLHRGRQPGELVCRIGRDDDDQRVRLERPGSLDDPIHHRRPRIGCRCLGMAERMRVPRPPAMTTAASLGRDSDTVGTLAGAPGFEPGVTGPNPVALPLGHAAVNRDAECTRRPVDPGD